MNLKEEKRKKLEERMDAAYYVDCAGGLGLYHMSFYVNDKGKINSKFIEAVNNNDISIEMFEKMMIQGL